MRCLPLFDSFLQRPGVTVGSPQAPSTSVVRTRANPTLALGVLIGVLYKHGISCVAVCAAMPHASICVPCVVFDWQFLPVGARYSIFDYLRCVDTLNLLHLPLV